MGITPFLRPSILAWSTSQQTTSFPMSENPAPATSPTYPVPMTQIFMARRNTMIRSGMLMKAMLLAAGRSTRLGVLGERLPKPLVPICGYAAIRFGCAALVRAGFREVVVNLHHHGAAIRTALGDGRGIGLAVAYSDEPELLGTGGGVAQAAPLLGDGPVLVMNAKVVADVDLRAVVAAHEASGADATLVLRDDPDAARWGAIATDPTGRIVSIVGTSGPRPSPGQVTERMFTGIQVISARMRQRLRP